MTHCVPCLQCSCVSLFLRDDHAAWWDTPREWVVVTRSTSVGNESSTHPGMVKTVKTKHVYPFGMKSSISHSKGLQNLPHTCCIACLSWEGSSRYVRCHGIVGHATPRVISRRGLWEPHIASITCQLPRLTSFSYCSSITNLPPGSVDQITSSLHGIDELLSRVETGNCLITKLCISTLCTVYRMQIYVICISHAEGMISELLLKWWSTPKKSRYLRFAMSPCWRGALSWDGEGSWWSQRHRPSPVTPRNRGTSNPAPFRHFPGTSVNSVNPKSQVRLFTP